MGAGRTIIRAMIASFLQEGRACFGETHPALATHEQFRPDFVLQIVNLPAQLGAVTDASVWPPDGHSVLRPPPRSSVGDVVPWD